MRRKLLLADDSVTIQRVVELTFSGEDIDVVTVGDGEQAIARIAAERPDIVLADIAMPKKNGYEVAAFVKDDPGLAHIPVLLLAGAFEPVDDDKARRARSDGVLVKPFETHEVIARVRALIQGGQAPVERPASNVAPFPLPRPAPPAGPAIPAETDESLDDYFDRLDVAFATRGAAPPAAPSPASAEEQDAALPTIDALIGSLGSLTPAEPPRPFPHLPIPAAKPAGAAQTMDEDAEEGNLLSDLFHLLLEVEQGDREASSIRTPGEIERIKRRNTIE